MGKQGRVFSSNDWCNLRAAVKLYDNAADYAIVQGNGKFGRRSDGGVNMRARGVRLTLALVYGDTVPTKCLSNRLGKCKPEQIETRANPRYAPYQNLVVLGPRTDVDHGRFKPLLAGSEELRIDYIIRPGNNKLLNTFHFVGTSQPSLDRRMCWWDVNGTSLADLKISLHSQWLLSKTGEVAVAEAPARTSGIWGTMIRIPQALEYGEEETKLVKLHFPILAASYIQERNPHTTGFTVSVNMHNHTFFMNTVLSYIKPDTIAPISRVVFSFRFDASLYSPPQPSLQETPLPDVDPSVPPLDTISLESVQSIRDTDSTSSDASYIAGNKKSAVESPGNTGQIADVPYFIDNPTDPVIEDSYTSLPSLPSSGSPVGLGARSPTTIAEDRMPVDASPRDASPPHSPNGDIHMSPPSFASDYFNEAVTDYVDDESSFTSSPSTSDSRMHPVDLGPRPDPLPNGNYTADIVDSTRREHLEERLLSSFGLSMLPLALSIPLRLPRLSILTPIPYKTWEIGRFQPLSNTPLNTPTSAPTLDYPFLFLDTDIWYPPYAYPQEPTDPRPKDNYGELNFVHEFA